MLLSAKDSTSSQVVYDLRQSLSWSVSCPKTRNANPILIPPWPCCTTELRRMTYRGWSPKLLGFQSAICLKENGINSCMCVILEQCHFKELMNMLFRWRMLFVSVLWAKIMSSLLSVTPFVYQELAFRPPTGPLLLSFSSVRQGLGKPSCAKHLLGSYSMMNREACKLFFQVLFRNLRFNLTSGST